MDGLGAETPVEFLGTKRTFRAVNLLEEEMSSGDEQRWQIKPHEISTVRLQVE